MDFIPEAGADNLRLHGTLMGRLLTYEDLGFDSDDYGPHEQYHCLDTERTYLCRGVMKGCKRVPSFGPCPECYVAEFGDPRPVRVIIFEMERGNA